MRVLFPLSFAASLLAAPLHAEDQRGWDHFAHDNFDLIYNKAVTEYDQPLKKFALARTSCEVATEDSPYTSCFYFHPKEAFSIHADDDGQPSQLNLIFNVDDLDDELMMIVLLIVTALDSELEIGGAAQTVKRMLRRAILEQSFVETSGATRFEIDYNSPSESFGFRLRNAAIPAIEPSDCMWTEVCDED